VKVVFTELEGHGPAELGVLGLVDYAHTSTAELLEYAVVGNTLASHVGNPPLRTMLGGACGQVNAIGLSRTVGVAEQFPGVLSAATSLRAGSTAKWSRQQTKISPRAPVRIMGAEWTQNGLGMISRLCAQ